MSEDYLWDLSGSDAEIEKLEAALASLAYKGLTPPALPLKRRASLTLPWWRPSFGFQIGLAMACVAVIAAGSLWLMMPRPTVVDQPDMIVEPHRPAIHTEDATNPPEPPIEGPRQNGRRDVLTASTKHLRSKPVKLVMTRGERIAPIIVTSEEAAAYKKLMLALSFTSSKLKVVKDTVEGGSQQRSINTSDK